MFKTSRISYGGTAAVVTSMALITGLHSADATKPIIISALLIAAFADNLTDALSIHVFQESAQLDQKSAFIGTITNFITRLLLCISFIPLIAYFPLTHIDQLSIIWGMLLLASITSMVAWERKVKLLPEIIKHLLVAVAVISASKIIGHWISSVIN
ncbi:hypothetical protein [Sulfuriferula nivalis]|uniref:Membrane protein n=1 Tax=Sulfuriferula nivalis TaxID=2675298 RepID=A0A809RYW2_9PROT|nr:hypothetical protein [Sulfuriferula nivalis]BBO99387.1 membrane protein [Sulfuriferula nivalis]